MRLHPLRERRARSSWSRATARDGKPRHSTHIGRHVPRWWTSLGWSRAKLFSPFSRRSSDRTRRSSSPRPRLPQATIPGRRLRRDARSSSTLCARDSTQRPRGRGALLLLVGEPGIGKSRLGEEVGREAHSRGAVVLVGRAWEAGGAPPYWPWVQSLRTLVSEIEDTRLRASWPAEQSFADSFQSYSSASRIFRHRARTSRTVRAFGSSRRFPRCSTWRRSQDRWYSSSTIYSRR